MTSPPYPVTSAGAAASSSRRSWPVGSCRPAPRAQPNHGGDDRRHQYGHLGSAEHRCSGEASSATNRATVNPIPASVRRPHSCGRARPAGSRPTPSRSARMPPPADPDRLARHQPGTTPHASRLEAAPPACPPHHHAGVGQGEQRHRHQGRQRVEPILQIAQHVAPRTGRAGVAGPAPRRPRWRGPPTRGREPQSQGRERRRPPAGPPPPAEHRTRPTSATASGQVTQSSPLE